MATLDELRGEIDAIDVTLHDLLIRRVEIGREVARAKAGTLGPSLRPGREAKIMRQLAKRNRDPLAHTSIGRIWREILSANLNQQISVSAAIFAPDPVLATLAHDYCGSTTKTIIKKNAQEVLDAVAAGYTLIGILPDIAGGDTWRWWPSLLNRSDDPKLRIIARLPFFGEMSGAPSALVVATQEPEDSGDDCSIFAVRETKGTTGTDVDVIDSWGEDGGWHVIELRGFRAKPDLCEHTWCYLGAYALPLTD